MSLIPKVKILKRYVLYTESPAGIIPLGHLGSNAAKIDGFIFADEAEAEVNKEKLELWLKKQAPK